MSISEGVAIFEQDEMIVPKLDKSWSREDLLNQEGLFFFKDIAKLLQLEATTIKGLVDTCIAAGQDPWLVVGVRKVWNHWLIRMKTFAPVYRSELQPRYQVVAKHWDGNTLLRQQGVFLLTDVCRKIPFTAGQLRHQVRQNPDAESEFGIWKDTEMGVFLVRMDRFAPWLQRLWADGFGDKSRETKPRSAARPRGKKAPSVRKASTAGQTKSKPKARSASAKRTESGKRAEHEA